MTAAQFTSLTARQVTVSVDGVEFEVRYDSDSDAIPECFATEMKYRDRWIDPRDILRDSLCNCIDWAVTRKLEAQAEDDAAFDAIDNAQFLTEAA